MKKIHLKLKALERSQHFSHYKFMGIFSDAQGAANSEVRDGILSKFKPVQAFIVDLVTCKNEEDPLENEGTRVVTTFLSF